MTDNVRELFPSVAADPSQDNWNEHDAMVVAYGAMAIVASWVHNLPLSRDGLMAAAKTDNVCPQLRRNLGRLAQHYDTSLNVAKFIAHSANLKIPKMENTHAGH